MKYNVVVLDLDNTLVDFDLMQEKALAETFKSYGIVQTPGLIADYNEINLGLWEKLEKGLISKKDLVVKRFADVFAKHNIDVDAASFNTDYMNSIPKYAELIAGADDLLKYLKGKASLIIMTNGAEKPQNQKMAKVNITDYFDHVIISDNVGKPKPSLVIFEYMMDLLPDVSKSDVLLIGDSLSSDIKGGVEFGLDTIWFNKYGKAAECPATFEVRKLEDIIAILEGK